MLGHTELRKDTLIELEGEPYRVIDYSHVAMGRGGAVARTKLKNLLSGAVVERSFRSADKIAPANIERAGVQFLYAEGSAKVFMNQTTFDQQTVADEVLGDQARFLAEGAEINLLSFKDKIIGMEMPNNVYLKITETEPGLRGNTATAALKPATVETGVTVMVPLFINQGDVIKVDTRTGQYLERKK